MAGHALIVGAGSGISASFARALHADGMRVGLVARDTDKLAALAKETDAQVFQCDATDAGAVEALFGEVDKAFDGLDVVLYNPSWRVRAPVIDVAPEDAHKALMVTVYGAFLVAQQAAKRMLNQGHGAIFFTGASAGVKGYAQSATFAMGKFGLRGLAQSMARELQPQNIHIAHFVIDGGVAGNASGRPVADGRSNTDENPDIWMEPDAIAENYVNVLKQHRSTWSWEIELRPWGETF